MAVMSPSVSPAYLVDVVVEVIVVVVCRSLLHLMHAPNHQFQRIVDLTTAMSVRLSK